MLKEVVVSNSPFMHSKNDVNRLFLYVCVALVFPSVFGIYFFGIYSLFMIVFSVLFCLASEILFNLYMTRKFTLKDISSVVTGIILALTLPINTPIYVIAICAFISVCIVKMSFGGLGKNFFNPALVGRCVAGVLVPDITTSLYKFVINGEVHTSLLVGGTNSISNLLSGRAVGGIGTTCSLMLFVIILVLSLMKIIDFKIPVLSIISYLAVSYFTNGVETALMNLCSGSFLFVATFIVTEPNVSPNNLLGKIIFAVGFGALSAVCWNYKLFGENCVFVVALFFNVIVPFMDKFLSSKPSTTGGFRNASKV